jgi:hypothetical protein
VTVDRNTAVEAETVFPWSELQTVRDESINILDNRNIGVEVFRMMQVPLEGDIHQRNLVEA